VKLNVGQILMKAGSSVLRSVVPGAGAVIDLVNAFLPEDKKLPEDATGTQAHDAIQSLPPDQRSQVLMKELDVEVEEIRGWTEVVKALSEADQAGASTRPQIAKAMSTVLVFMLLSFTVAWVYSVVATNVAVLRQISSSWEIFVVVLGYPMWVIKRYFGARETDKKVRAAAALGQPPDLGGVFKGIMKTFKGA
jgi:hypothetical protein